MEEQINSKLDEIICTLQLLLEKNHELEQRIQILDNFLQRSIEDRVLSITDLAHRYKTSKSTLISNPWILPNFGVSDFSIGIKRWKMSTVILWESISEKKRQEDWSQMLTSTKTS